MAWAEKLATGWRGRYRDQNGVKQPVTQADGSLFPRKRDAIDAADEAAVKGRRQAAVDQGSLSARIAWGDWWDTIVTDRAFEDSDTASIERGLVEKYIRPKWGAVALNKVSHKSVQRWVDTELKVCKGMSAKYARRIYSVFQASMNRAVADEVLIASPCTRIKLPKVPKRSKPQISISDAAAMGEHLRADYRDALEFQLETGLRPGELCGLHVHRVNQPAEGWLEVAEVLVRRQKRIRPFPKDDDVRHVPLTTKALQIIGRRTAGRELSGGCGMEHTDGEECDGALVFLTERGRPMHPDAVGQCLRRAAELAGLPRRSMYAGRRGFATRAARGMDAFELAEVLGHADVRETRGYVQMTEEARGRMAAALGETGPLKIVGRGAPRGAEVDQQAPSGTVIEPRENTG